MIEKFLPLFIMPFLIQSAIVPMFLGMLKFMLFKSLMVGKLALALILLNAFKNHNSFKGRDAEMADVLPNENTLPTKLSNIRKQVSDNKYDGKEYNTTVVCFGKKTGTYQPTSHCFSECRAVPSHVVNKKTNSQEEKGGPGAANYYRLPKHVVPKNYKLKLWPDMSEKTFNGSVAIQIQLLEPTQTIQLHSNKLSTNTTSDRRELLVVDLFEEVPKGTYEIHVSFGGKLDNEIVGLYSSSFKNGRPQGIQLRSLPLDSIRDRK
ncbi:Uncharacterized protein OBRU01_23880, partial [Operophtera brumata]